MRWIVGLGILLFLVVGCGKKDPPPQLMTPGTRLIYHGGSFGIWTFCDRGNRIYMNERGPMQIIPGGCPNGEP